MSERGSPLAGVAAGAASVATVTLTGSAGTTVYLSGFTVDGLGATASSSITVTVAGLLGGSRLYRVVVPAGATVGLGTARLVMDFANPIPASGPNTAITVSATSFGTGNTASNVAAHGFHR